MTNLFNYIERKSAIHNLTGATKLICLMLWSFAAMGTYDTRYLAVLSLLSMVLFKIGHIRVNNIEFHSTITVLVV